MNERGNPLLPPSQRIIENHWLVNKCINGYPDSEKARKSLEADLKNIRLNVYQDPTTVATVAAEDFPVNSEKRNEITCGNCLFHAQTMQNFIKHFGKQNKLSCKKIPIHRKMVQLKYGIAIPEEMLKRIKKGEKIMKRDDWMLRFNTPSSNMPQEVEQL